MFCSYLIVPVYQIFKFSWIFKFKNLFFHCQPPVTSIFQRADGPDFECLFPVGASVLIPFGALRREITTQLGCRKHWIVSILNFTYVLFSLAVRDLKKKDANLFLETLLPEKPRWKLQSLTDVEKWKNVINQPIVFPPLNMTELSGSTPADGTFSNRIIYAQLDDSSRKKENNLLKVKHLPFHCHTAAVKGISPHNSSPSIQLWLD